MHTMQYSSEQHRPPLWGLGLPNTQNIAYQPIPLQQLPPGQGEKYDPHLGPPGYYNPPQPITATPFPHHHLHHLQSQRSSLMYGNVDGLGVLQHGGCAKIKRSSLWIHLAINALSTALLSANIGVSSLRNLGKISWTRFLLWLFLMLSSVPLHFLYNSAVFTTLETNSYSTTTVSEGALNRYLSNTTSSDLYYFTDPRTFNHTDKLACMKAYGKQMISDRRDVIIVTDGSAGAKFTGSHGFQEAGTNTGRQPFDWLCDSTGVTTLSCNIDDAIARIDNWKMNGGNVQYCLSEYMEENCSLGYSLQIMTIVIVCNVIKCICMLLAVFLSRNLDDTLVTIGDAIESFLNKKDLTTTGMCTASKKDIKDGVWGPVMAQGLSRPLQARIWTPQRKAWFRAAGIWQWVLCIGLALVGIVTVLGFLFVGIANWNEYGVSRTPASMWKLGFGSVNTLALAETPTNASSTSYRALVSAVLLSNLPQVIFSFLYLLYNSLFTCMLLASEWERFATDRRPLRTTTPKGEQRSTYFLHLPYRYSIPLMIGSLVMHWFISQSIFLARILEFKGGTLTDYSITTTGYSPIAILFAVVLGLLMLLIVSAMGLRRYSGHMPLAGSCSAAISAACHTQEWGVAQMPVMWGVTEVNGGVGHCAFSGAEVGKPVAGAWYAGEK
ncbi:uncharacterized protein LAJ45_02608 [Morchella importuna]|uniref:uncharacterized protein n=1 Tax=Morchella importuna TaxID=1174673 RepID=UPI001E8D0832|nr:uncharacterized protein LAJ45_02608 [Morchella importuna]KAH8153021.1 hypothetical protein LAJ45_02608 [Morchella importuna]